MNHLDTLSSLGFKVHFPCVNYCNWHENSLINIKKGWEVSLKTRSLPASLSGNGQGTKQATVKWSHKLIVKDKTTLFNKNTKLKLVRAYT